MRARWLLWAGLAVPALLMVADAVGDPVAIEELLHPSGEWSARALVVALALTPLGRLWPGARGLLRHRRAIGLAAFGYAVLHLVFYVVAMASVADMLAELGALGIWTGWVALALLVPVAVTSNDAAMRALRVAWKRVQRLAYPAALFTLAHWVAVHDGWTAALAHFVPLALLELSRFVPRSFWMSARGAFNA